MRGSSCVVSVGAAATCCDGSCEQSTTTQQQRMRIMRGAVVALIITILPAGSLLKLPTALPAWPSQLESCPTRRPCGVQQVHPRRQQAIPTMQCKEGARGGNHAGSGAAAAAGTGNRGSWGAGLPWVAGAASFSRSALHATTPSGIGAWWNGGSLGGGGGNNNGTDGGARSGGAMDGEGGDEEEDVNACRSSFSGSGGSSRNDGPAEVGGIRPPLEPWVWLSAIWGLYVTFLRRSPLLAKALTSGLLAVGGDMAAQFFEFQQQQGGGGSGQKGPFLKDVRRLLSVAIDSMLITGPALHVLYGLLETLIPTAAGGFIPAASHLLIDTFVFDPMFVTSFFCVTGILESRSLKRDVLPALRREFWPAVRGSWVVSFFFCPLQFVTFRYLPLEFRVLSVNVCDIAWTSVLSYFSHKSPPKEGEEKARRADANGGRKRASARREKTGKNIAGGRNMVATFQTDERVPVVA